MLKPIDSTVIDPLEGGGSNEDGFLQQMEKLYEHGQECCKITTFTVLLIAMNLLTVMLLFLVGGILEDFNKWGDDKKHHLKEEHKEIIIYVGSMMTILLVNLGTLYSLCKRTQSKRHFKAATAVFLCNKTRKEYKDATVPYMDVLRQIEKESNFCEISLARVGCFLLFIPVGFVGFVFLSSYMYHSSPEGLLVTFGLIAVVLWACVVRHRVHILIAPEESFEEFSDSVLGEIPPGVEKAESLPMPSELEMASTMEPIQVV